CACIRAPIVESCLSPGTENVEGRVRFTQLIEPGTVYEARRNQLDLRFNKTVKLRSKVLFTGNVGVNNVLNRNDVKSIQTTYDGQWLKPTSVMDARLLQVSARLDF